MAMTKDYDDEDFAAFMAKVDDVSQQISGLTSGEVDIAEFDRIEEDRKKKDMRAEEEVKRKEARREAARLEAEAAARVKVKEAEKLAQFKEENREKLEALKQDYYLRKARRERWEAFRTEQKERGAQRGFADYYRGWELFEDDPDEDLFSGDTPAAVQDQAAFDLMAKDVQERTAKRKAEKAAADKEKEAGNTVFKEGQISEALAAYTRAIEHFKGDKAVLCNRALCHLKLRNFLSAVEDTSRVLEIARFLDDDIDRRPPPPTVVKAYVRRATAHVELEHFDEADEDLKAAAAMAADKDLAEVKKAQLAARAEREAARREREACVQLECDDDESAERITKVREALEQMRALTLASATASSAESLAAMRVHVETLTRLVGGSAPCRLCLRQAGGVALLVPLLPKLPLPVCALLTEVCADRRCRLEFHASGGTQAVLRQLRAAVPAEPQPETNEVAEVAGRPTLPTQCLQHLAPQLELLELCCRHSKVVAAVRPLAINEGSFGRLVTLLSSGAPARSAPPVRRAWSVAHAAGAALISTWAKGPEMKPLLLPHAPKLSAALVRLLVDGSPNEKALAATAAGNLSVAKAYRLELVRHGIVSGLIELAVEAVGSANEEALLPNALAALHNCSLVDTAMAELATARTAAALMPLLTRSGADAPSKVLLRRAAAIVSKGATRSAEVVQLLLDGDDPVLHRVAALFREELEAHLGDGATSSAAPTAGEVEEAPEAEEAEGEEGAGSAMLGTTLRLLAACARDEVGAALVCDAGALPGLAKLVCTSSAGKDTRGNAAMCIADCAKEPRCLAVLSVYPLVPPLLDIAHHSTGQEQKNAAIALGRLAKSPRCLQAIRDNHGIEILARSMTQMKM